MSPRPHEESDWNERNDLLSNAVSDRSHKVRSKS